MKKQFYKIIYANIFIVLFSCSHKGENLVFNLNEINNDIINNCGIDIQQLKNEVEKKYQSNDIFEVIAKESVIDGSYLRLYDVLGVLKIINGDSISINDVDSLDMEFKNAICNNLKFEQKEVLSYFTERTRYKKREDKSVFNHNPGAFDIMIDNLYHKEEITYEELGYLLVASYVMYDVHMFKYSREQK